MEGTRKYMLKVDDHLCHACRVCLAKNVCRGNAFIRFEHDEAPFLDMSRCWGCLDCMPVCPFDAVIRHDYSRLNNK